MLPSQVSLLISCEITTIQLSNDEPYFISVRIIAYSCSSPQRLFAMGDRVRGLLKKLDRHIGSEHHFWRLGKERQITARITGVKTMKFMFLICFILVDLIKVSDETLPNLKYKRFIKTKRVKEQFVH